MSFDEKPARIRGWLRHIEFDLAILLFIALVIDGLSISTTLSELIFFFVFFVPGFLALTVLVRSSLDAYLVFRMGKDTITQISRAYFLIQFAFFWVICLLAGATLSIVLLTFFAPAEVNGEGGVVFGPFLWMMIGTVLAGVILLRFAVERFLIDDPQLLPGTMNE